jgi:signal transduction histidine kinase
MDPEDKKSQPERERTDESLRTERMNTDQAMAESRARIDENADKVVERAREQADAVLDAARDELDSKMNTAEAGVDVNDALARARALEDELLEDERAAADETLRREREEQARTLAALLPLEREKTDRHLLIERIRSDDALAHRDDFMGMVSHDLRNLLSGISLNATLLSKNASEGEEGRRTVVGMERIQRYVARMNRLIGDLIDIVSIDAGKLAVHPVSCDAAALFTEAVEAFAQSASEKGISLEAKTVERVLIAEFDHERMLQVLANFITNALKFTPRGGRIAVRGERAGDDLCISVSDTGVGIPSDMLEAVFERFWQVGKNDRRGLGLGLYISKCIVHAHGGRIWAESKLGEGSMFHFTIPAEPAPPARAATNVRASVERATMVFPSGTG